VRPHGVRVLAASEPVQSITHAPRKFRTIDDACASRIDCVEPPQNLGFPFLCGVSIRWAIQALDKLARELSSFCIRQVQGFTAESVYDSAGHGHHPNND
jgi:hypothetical protein